MGTKLSEMRDGCFARAMDDEPMFVLLGRDASAPQRVRDWATQRSADISMGKKPSSDMDSVNEAFECAARMEAWREKNDGAWRAGLFADAAMQNTGGKGVEAPGQESWNAPYGRHPDGRPKELGELD